MPVRFPCIFCLKPVAVSHKGIFCDVCEHWVHAKCNNTSNDEYRNLVDSDAEAPWSCQKCIKTALPFNNISDECLKLLSQGKNDTSFFEIDSNANAQFFQDINLALENLDPDDETLCPYSSLSEINSLKINKSKSLSFLNLNIASLKLHQDELNTLIKNCDIDFSFIGISETGFQKDSPNEVKIENFKSIDTTTKGTRGGTRLYVNKNFNYLPRKDLEINKAKKIESTIVEIVNEPKNFLVAVIYRHPKMDCSEFNILYSNLLEKISQEKKQAFIMGDFNIDLLKHESHEETQNFIQNNLSHFFKPLITRPTRITPHSKTLIDNVFTNTLEPVIHSGNMISTISDHLPQLAIVQWKDTGGKVIRPKKPKRDMRNFNRENFLLDFLEIPWEELFTNKNPSEKLEIFIKSSQEKIDNHAPIGLTRQKHVTAHKPWVTKGLLKSIKTKDNLYKKFLRSRQQAFKATKHQNYKTYKNLLIKLLRKSKNNYYKNYFETHKTNLKLVWKAINEVTNRKGKQDLSPNLIVHKNKKLSKDKEIAEVFNEYYGSIAEKTKADIPETDKIFHDFMGPPIQHSFYMQPTTPQVIAKTILQLDDSKATGPFSIPSKFLKMINPTASVILCEIFNECVQAGIYPECLKKAAIKPLHKKESKLDIGNYRPISLLSNINKIFEKILHNRLTEFFNFHNVIFDNQFGFREKHSTNHALIALTELVRKALDNNQFSAGIFIDLKKAFDTVDHNILLQKLNHYGIRGKTLDMLTSYLSNRSHCTQINNTFSNFVKQNHGVPQGSVLGPLFFIIYINDLNGAIKNSTTIHFADDTSLICSEKSLKKLNKMVNRDLSVLVQWLRSNKICLNTSKTEIILFRKKNKNINKTLNFRLSGQRMKLSKSTKYLGVIIDEHLDWNIQLNNLTDKLARAVGVISKLRHYLSYKALLSVYYALFDSHLNYCLQSLGHIKVSDMNKLESLQNKVVRIIHFKGPRDSVKSLFTNSRILPIPKQIKLKNCLFAYDFLKNKQPNYFNNFLSPLGQNHQIRTRAAGNVLNIQMTKTVTYGSYNIPNLISKDWNSIHPHVPSIHNVSKPTFKKHLHAYILTEFAT